MLIIIIMSYYLFPHFVVTPTHYVDKQLQKPWDTLYIFANQRFASRNGVPSPPPPSSMLYGFPHVIETNKNACLYKSCCLQNNIERGEGEEQILIQ